MSLITSQSEARKIIWPISGRENKNILFDQSEANSIDTWLTRETKKLKKIKNINLGQFRSKLDFSTVKLAVFNFLKQSNKSPEDYLIELRPIFHQKLTSPGKLWSKIFSPGWFSSFFVGPDFLRCACGGQRLQNTRI